MLALRKTRPAPGAELVQMDFAKCPPAGNEVDVSIHAAGVCGSDLHAVAWDAGYGFMEPLLPLTIGHEFSGVVIATGADVTHLNPGDRVVCWPTVPCGTCAGCAAQQPLTCEARRIVGLHSDGGFADRARVPASVLHRIPETLPFDLAALCEPLSVAVNAVNLAQITPGANVVVLGPGPIGAACAFVAQQRGARVLLAGMKDDKRLCIARDMGIAASCDLSETPLADAVETAFGTSADRVIEATGAAASITQGLEVLRPQGILVVGGIHNAPLSLDLARFVREKKQMRGAHDTSPAAFAEAMDLLGSHGAALSHLITHRLPLERALDGIEFARSGSAMKVLLLPDQTSDQTKGRPE